MRKCALRFHLREVICIFILNLFLFGCVTTGTDDDISTPDNVPSVAVAEFDINSYLLRDLTKDDLIMLQEYNKSKLKNVSAEAGLLIGYYYLQQGDADKAQDYISKYSGSSDLSAYSRQLARIFRVDVALLEGDIVGAEIWSDRVLEQEGREEWSNALTTYCEIHDIAPMSDFPYDCLLEQVNIAKVRAIESDLQLTDAPLDILVLATDSRDTIGVVYYIQKKNLQHRISVAEKYDEATLGNHWDYIIDINNMALAARGYNIDFKPSLDDAIMYMPDYLDLASCGKVLFGFGAGYRETIDGLIGFMKDSNIEERAISLGDTSPYYIRQILGEWDGTQFCAIAAGTEDEINQFVPSARQYILDENMQKLFYMVSIDSGKNYRAVTMPYYMGRTVYTDMELTFSQESRAFAAEYRLFAGMDVSAKSLLGYDMMHFIYKLSEEGGEDTDLYQSGIIYFADGKAHRQLEGYFIRSLGDYEAIDTGLVYENITPIDELEVARAVHKRNLEIQFLEAEEGKSLSDFIEGDEYVLPDEIGGM